MRLFFFSIASLVLVACGSSSPGTSPSSGSATAVAGGDAYTTTDAMLVYGRTFVPDREGFRIVISEQPGMCSEVNVEKAGARYLILDLDAPKIAPGVYTFEAGTEPIGRVEADVYRLDATCQITEETNSTTTGSVTIDEIDAHRARGSFSFVNTEGKKFEGTFDAPNCDLDAEAKKLGPEAKRECR